MWPATAIERGPAFAVLLPLIAGLIGIAIALVPRLETWVRACVLVV